MSHTAGSCSTYIFLVGLCSCLSDRIILLCFARSIFEVWDVHHTYISRQVSGIEPKDHENSYDYVLGIGI